MKTLKIGLTYSKTYSVSQLDSLILNYLSEKNRTCSDLSILCRHLIPPERACILYNSFYRNLFGNGFHPWNMRRQIDFGSNRVINVRLQFLKNKGKVYSISQKEGWTLGTKNENCKS